MAARSLLNLLLSLELQDGLPLGWGQHIPWGGQVNIDALVVERAYQIKAKNQIADGQNIIVPIIIGASSKGLYDLNTEGKIFGSLHEKEKPQQLDIFDGVVFLPINVSQRTPRVGSFFLSDRYILKRYYKANRQGEEYEGKTNTLTRELEDSDYSAATNYQRFSVNRTLVGGTRLLHYGMVPPISFYETEGRKNNIQWAFGCISSGLVVSAKEINPGNYETWGRRRQLY